MDRKLSASIKSLIYILEKNSKFNFKALIGFDGFIIEHLNAVKSGNNLNDYTKIHSLKEFSTKYKIILGLEKKLLMN